MTTENYKAVQGHGEAFENVIKSAFPGASNSKRTQVETFDIENKFDKNLGLSTSIKTSKNDIICMADARRVFAIDKPFRLIILQYNQEENCKIPATLFEFFPTKQEWNDIKGSLPYLEVAKYHEKLTSFKNGEHVKARIVSQEIKSELLKKYSTSLMLNPKIDSKNQRRLQVSIKLKTLLEKIKNINIIKAKNNSIMYKGISIGAIESLPRSFKNKTLETVASEGFCVNNPIMPIHKNQQIALF